MLCVNLDMGDCCHKACSPILKAPFMRPQSSLKSIVVTGILVTACMAQKRKMSLLERNCVLPVPSWKLILLCSIPKVKLNVSTSLEVRP